MKKNEVYIISVDDDVEFNTLIEKKFRSKGIRFVATSTIKEFTQKIKEEPPSLCLVDVNLAESVSAGFTLLKALRNTLGNLIPIFIFSARNAEDDIVNALTIGATDYITKPLDFDFLLAKISRYLDITDIETREYPFITIPTKNELCQLSMEFELHSLSEFSLTVRSTNYISKGTMVKVDFSKSDISEQKDCTLDVSNVWRDEKNNLFYITLDFNSEDNKLLEDVRKWLTEKSEQKKD